jgi:Flp pilus assembly protein TadG
LDREPGQGQILVLFAFVLVALLGASALAVDYASWLLGRRTLQNVTDAAALAGSRQLATAGACGALAAREACARQDAWRSIIASLGLTTANALTLAASNTGQGTPYTEAGYSIWVDTPPNAAGTDYPSTGTYGSSTTALYARVEVTKPSFFSSIDGQHGTKVGAWATAGSLRAVSPAVAGLCGIDPVDNSDCTGGQKTAVKINTNNGIKIVNGDFTSNKGLFITSGPGLVLSGGLPYIVGAGNCSPHTWSCPPSANGGITDAGTPPTAISAIELSPKEPDPGYAQPAWTNCTSPTVTANCIPVRGTGANGSGANYTPGSFVCKGNNANACGTGIPEGSATGSGTGITCSANAPRLAPGYYDTISNSGCLILDATSPGSTTSYTSITGLWNGQRPGIYRVHTALNVSYLVGDGVSIFLDPGASISIGSALILNTNNTCQTPPGMPTWSTLCSGQDFSDAAWSTTGVAPWDACAQSGLPATTRCVTLASGHHAVDGIGLAIYIRPPTATELPPNGCGQSTAGSRTSCVFSQHGNFGLQILGTIYGPRDNVTVGGNGSQASTGQIIAWTITYSGTTELTQTFAGPIGPDRPFLLEPTLGE